MAFSKAPSQSTYQTKDVKLIWALDSRQANSDKDTVAINGFFDIVRDKSTKDEDYFFVKRDGCTKYPYTFPLVEGVEPSNIRGQYYWEDKDVLFVVYGSSVALLNGSDASLIVTRTPFTSTTGEVGFTEFLFDDGTAKVVISDGLKLVTYDETGTETISADADLPSPHKPSIIFLDGYLFLIKETTSDIYNSNLDDPLAWTPGDFLTAEMLPDTLVKLYRLNNYLVAMGTASIEYFFDAGNASGSPLQRNDTPVKSVGFLGGDASFGNKVFFVGQTASTSPEVLMLEDFKMEEIGPPPLRRILQNSNTFSAATLSNGGHDFYVLTMDDETWAMDLETRVWTKWRYQQDTTFPVTSSVSLIYSNKGHVAVFSLKDKPGIYYFDPALYQDNGSNFTTTVQTNREFFDSLHNKFMARVLIFGDKVDASVQVSYSDDDYATFSTPRSISLNQAKPQLTRWGYFISRAFKLALTANVPCRLRHLEVDFNIGNR